MGQAAQKQAGIPNLSSVDRRMRFEDTGGIPQSHGLYPEIRRTATRFSGDLVALSFHGWRGSSL